MTAPAAPAPVVGEPPTYVTVPESETGHDAFMYEEPPPPPLGRLDEP